MTPHILPRWVFLLILCAGLQAAPVAAQAIIIDHEDRPAPLTLRQHRVEANVQERLAVVTVTHEFHNAGPATVEGTLLFPLPPEAQVSRFVMDVDGEEMVGEVLPSDKARRIYEDIVRRSLDPALLEMADYRTFRARIFPIPPGATRTITLRYDAALPVDGQTVAFRYPLQGTLSHRTAGRPMPHPHGTPDPSDPPRPDNHASAQRLVHIRIATSEGVRNVYSPSHTVDVRRADNRHAEAVFEDAEVLDDRDFLLYYTLDAGDIGATLLTHRPYRDRPGYFLLLVDPPAEIDDQRLRPQDIVFVLDTSGSMRGEKMAQARDALRYCLTHLGDRDRFGVVAFSTDVNAFRNELRPADEQDDALYFVDQLEASGGTNIHDALLAATDMLDDSENGLIVFLTDGLPSIGVTNEADIRARVAEAGGGRVRLFPFGVGYDVNTRLLDGLARGAKTFASYISPDETIDARVASFFDKVRHPVMTNLDLAFDGVDAFALTPRTPPTLYKGSALLIAGRYRTPGEGRVVLTGQLAGRRVTRPFTFRLPDVERDRDFVARLWATRRVGQLLEEIRLKGEHPELKEEVVALATEFGLVTPYTSYLVQEEEPLAGGATPTPRGERFRDLDAAPPQAAMDATSGFEAVSASKQLRAMQEVQAVPQEQQAGQAVIQGQVLHQHADGAWTSLATDAVTTNPVRLRFASDAYFAFLRLYPDAAAFARLGAEVTFVFHNQTVQIGADEDDNLTEARLQRIFG